MPKYPCGHVGQTVSSVIGAITHYRLQNYEEKIFDAIPLVIIKGMVSNTGATYCDVPDCFNPSVASVRGRRGESVVLE